MFSRFLIFTATICYPSTMPDNRPGAPDRKPSWIGPLVIAGVIAVIALTAVLITASQPKPAPAPEPQAVAPLTPAKIVALPPPTLTRNEILQNAVMNAAAYATGAKATTEKSPLLGREFTIRIPFGCDGPGGASAASQAYVEVDATTSAVKLVARPAAWATLPVVQDLAGSARIEAVEGFWIPRPWTNSEACPPKRETPLPATPTPAAAQTVGLAQVFEKGGSRVLARGDRPYEFVVKPGKDGASVLGHTYRLVLAGRLVGFGDGRAAHCWSESPDHRPICLYAVAYDRVAFEDDTGASLAEWKPQ
jgi:hypothetical protein